MISGCAPRSPVGQGELAPDPRNAVVQLLCERSEYDGTALVLSYTPCCNAFAVRDGPAVALYTAAHCLQGAREGQELRYFTRLDMLAHGHPVPSVARVLTQSGMDRAVLLPMAGYNSMFLFNAALDKGSRSAAFNGRLQACSAVHGWSYLDGHALAPALAGFVMTDLDVSPGWSGAPVLGARGEVVGIVVSCSGDASHPCFPRSGNYVTF